MGISHRKLVLGPQPPKHYARVGCACSLSPFEKAARFPLRRQEAGTGLPVVAQEIHLGHQRLIFAPKPEHFESQVVEPRSCIGGRDRVHRGPVLAGYVYRDQRQTPNSLAPPIGTSMLCWYGNPDVSQAATVQHLPCQARMWCHAEAGFHCVAPFVAVLADVDAPFWAFGVAGEFGGA